MIPSEIRTLRKSLGLSVKDFATAIGFDGPNRGVTIYRYETGQRSPSPQVEILMRMLKSNTVSNMKR